ncbi:MAG: hypothetical protein ACR2NP_08865 [Pirellulaceae bacterium]
MSTRMVLFLLCREELGEAVGLALHQHSIGRHSQSFSYDKSREASRESRVANRECRGNAWVVSG